MSPLHLLNLNSPEFRRELEERIRDEREGRRLDEEAELFAARAEQELRGSAPQAIPANAVRLNLPANSNPLAPQDSSRRARFREHLVAMAEGAVLDRERLAIDPAEAAAPASGRETLSTRACAACRGGCCRAGGDHAYVTEETIARSLEGHPGWTLARVLDSYLAHLPVESYQNSCIYHAATGCGLPRALRSSTCNRYQCAPLTILRSRLPEHHPPPVLAFMFDHGLWTRTALLDETGVRVLEE